VREREREREGREGQREKGGTERERREGGKRARALLREGERDR